MCGWRAGFDSEEAEGRRHYLVSRASLATLPNKKLPLSINSLES